MTSTTVSGQEPVVVSEQLQARVKAAIERAKSSPSATQLTNGTGQASLIAYASIKVGVPADTPAIKNHIEQLQKQIDNGLYKAGQEPQPYVYEMACHAMLLADADPVGNKDRLLFLRDYLVRSQLKNGSWYYPVLPNPQACDTSVTQFAILGLWAVHRAEIEVPRDTLAKAAKWLIDSQKEGGGFAYHPFEGGGRPKDLVPSGSMTVAGLGTLGVIKQILYSDPLPTPTNPMGVPVNRRKFGVLEQAALEGVKPDKVDKPAKRSVETVHVSRDAIDKAMHEASKALAEIFPNGIEDEFPVYFLYACERAGTLVGTEAFGSHEWYNEGVDFLLTRQQPTGDWGTFKGHVPGPSNTAFAMLFLSRATRTLIKKAPKEKLVGGGLLAGGRGLPDDLDRVDIQDGTVKQRLKKGAIDDLLSQLEQPKDLSLPSIQEAIVESVSLDKPDELIGQLDRLQKLARHPQSEVRQVAVWALGRSGDYRMTPDLIKALADPDLVVVWEASLALTVISRMPLGIPPVNGKQPLPIAPPEVTPDDANSAVAYRKWVDQTQAAWDAWYLRVRPYDERDDRRQLPRK